MNKLYWDWNDNPKEINLKEVLVHVGEGWHPLVTKLIDDLFAAGWDGKIAQIKEKFGGLRFYVHSATSEQYQLISDAEQKSVATCEFCGEPGRPRSSGKYWIKTTCDRHHEERMNQK